MVSKLSAIHINPRFLADIKNRREAHHTFARVRAELVVPPNENLITSVFSRRDLPPKVILHQAGRPPETQRQRTAA
jgi:hypothetical protein